MKHCVGVMTVDMTIPAGRSLKDRRSVVNSVKERVKHRCNVSVYEEPSETWQSAALAFACVAETESLVESQFKQVAGIIEQEPRLMVYGSRIQYYV
jgi:uncharacterized protein YlxP (DUF503 family)